MREMAEAAQIFNPLYLCKMTTADIVTVLPDVTDKLKACQFHQFDTKFFTNLRKEQPFVVAAAKRDHDLAKIPSTRQYLTRMQRRIKRKKLEKGATLDWKEDAGDYSQRIWQWWKGRKDKFPYHGTAIRLIVLAQLSSCSVERVFSKLERIRQQTGDRLKEDMCEVRLLMQCNGDLDEMIERRSRALP